MQLRTATRADLDLLRFWDTQPHVIAFAGEPDENDWDWENELGREVPWREFLIGEIDGRPIGFIQIIDPAEEESHYWGDVAANLRAIDIWIGEPGDIRKGHGSAMMRLALARCFAPAQVTAVLIDPLSSNTDAHRFYEAMGFSFVREQSFGSDHCFIYQLTRADWHARSTKNA